MNKYKLEFGGNNSCQINLEVESPYDYKFWQKFFKTVAFIEEENPDFVDTEGLDFVVQV